LKQREQQLAVEMLLSKANLRFGSDNGVRVRSESVQEEVIKKED